MEFIESNQLMHCSGRIVSVEKATYGKRIILLYFGRAGELSCSPFLAKLKRVYNKGRQLHFPLEIIYVPLDKDAEIMRTHFKQEHGPWYTILPGDPAIWILKIIYDVSCIPSVVVLDIDGNEISRNGTEDIENLGIDALVAWNNTQPS